MAAMSKLILSVALCIALAPALHAKDDPAPQLQLDTVLAQHSFMHRATVPFALDADFVGQANVPTPGRLKLRWQSSDRWWSRVDFGRFEQVTIRNGEMEYTVRNASFTPIQVVELYHLLGLDDKLQSVSEIKVRPKVAPGFVCWQARVANEPREVHEFCADSRTHDLLSNLVKTGTENSRSQRFADYTDGGELRYPRRLELLINGSRIISATISSLGPLSFDPALLNPPQNAMVRRKCADLKAPVAIKKKAVDLKRRLRFSTHSTLALTVLADGSVGDVNVIQRGGTLLDKSALDSLKEWKFSPATCGGEPVIDDGLAEVEYHMIRLTAGRSFKFMSMGAVTVTFRDWVR